MVVVTHPEPIALEAKPLPGRDPEGAVALGYYYDGRLVARGIVAHAALEAITGLLAHPVTLALAASEDDAGNIDARVCLVLPIDPDTLSTEGEDEPPEEAWRTSVPALPEGIETPVQGQDPSQPKMALLPIGNVVRGRSERHHLTNIAADAHEMLENLVGGRAQDAVRKAIDDLLNSL